MRSHFVYALAMGMFLSGSALAENSLGMHGNSHSADTQNKIDRLRDLVTNREDARDYALGKGQTNYANQLQDKIDKENAKINNLLNKCSTCN